MEKFITFIKQNIDSDRGYRLLHFISRNRIIGFIIGLFFGRNLTALAIINNTDKFRVGRNQYTSIYQQHLRPYKYKAINILEIGVGGYKRQDRGGCSLRMWKRYFPYGKIYAIDIYDKSKQEEQRIKIFKGSQIDFDFLNNVIDAIPAGLDIVIDDGSHMNEHVIGSFCHLFPLLKSGALYVVEDVETSYNIDYGGDFINLNNPQTTMGFFKQILDNVNINKFNSYDYQCSVYNFSISSIHFYQNLIFIYKV